MVKMTGRKALFESLKLQGVEYIFGNPGTSESPIMHELQFHPEFKYVLVFQIHLILLPFHLLIQLMSRLFDIY